MYHEERRKLLGLLLINSGVSYIQRIKKRTKRRTRRSCWMKEWLIKRDSLNAHNNTIFKELYLYMEIWATFLVCQENYLLLTSTNFNLLKISLQNKRTRIIYVHVKRKLGSNIWNLIVQERATEVFTPFLTKDLTT